MTDQTRLPTPDEARRLLAEADSTGRHATARAGWPGVAVLLSLGSVLSLGTLALGLTTGTNYFVAMIALLVWIGVVVAFQLAFLRSHRIGFGRRWGLYIAAMFAIYLVAMLVVGSSEGRAVGATCLAAAALLVVSVAAATHEARQVVR